MRMTSWNHIKRPKPTSFPHNRLEESQPWICLNHCCLPTLQRYPCKFMVSNWPTVCKSEKWKELPASVPLPLSLVRGCLSSPSSVAPVEGRLHSFLRPGLWPALSCLTWEPTWSATSISLWLQVSHPHLKVSYPGGTHPSSKHTQTHSHTHSTSLWPIFSPGKTSTVKTT